MKNLSDFKKALTLGSIWQTTYHLDFAGRNENNKVLYKDKDLGIRPVSIVQTNSVAFKTTKQDGTLTDSWLQWPKASECKFIDENTLFVYETDRNGSQVHVLTYKQIK